MWIKRALHKARRPLWGRRACSWKDCFLRSKRTSKGFIYTIIKQVENNIVVDLVKLHRRCWQRWKWPLSCNPIQCKTSRQLYLENDGKNQDDAIQKRIRHGKELTMNETESPCENGRSYQFNCFPNNGLLCNVMRYPIEAQMHWSNLVSYVVNKDKCYSTSLRDNAKQLCLKR